MPQRRPQMTQDRSQWINGLSLEQKFWEALTLQYPHRTKLPLPAAETLSLPAFSSCSDSVSPYPHSRSLGLFAR